MSEAFVYSWRNKADDRLYIGYHKGQPTDGYVASSKIFLKEYRQNPANFERFIIGEGTISDMRSLETKILQSVNAADSDEFYNQHNNNSKNGVVMHSLKTKKKIAAKAIGRVVSAETKLKMSLTHKARWAAGYKHSPEAKAKMLAVHLGAKRSEQSKARMRAAR
jgi:hypothetical protein